MEKKSEFLEMHNLEIPKILEMPKILNALCVLPLMLIVVLFFNVTLAPALFAQETDLQQNLMFDPDSPYLLQDVPIYQGVDEFQLRLDKVRSEENREPLGLVLCGGSARAYAHMGVLKALEENKITPDFIIANSMGAIIGMLYAYGFSPEKIAQMIGDIELTQFFEPLIPTHGGVLSVRAFKSFLNELVGTHLPDGKVEAGFDIKDSSIPIIILTEDLYTKRQIWNASGDFATIMTGAFSMPVYMEPQKYKLDDGTDVRIVDSGTLDIGGLKVANHFSSNLIISTAFYDTKLNYNSVLTVLNRTMSIGKERIIVSDLKKLKPAIIRNEVENYSFMSFDKAKEFFQIGYDSAMKVMPVLVKLPHGYDSMEERRKITDVNADMTFQKVNSESSIPKSENYFGLKVWPVFPITEYPLFNLYDKDNLSAFAFLDTRHFVGKVTMNFPFEFEDFNTQLLLQFDPVPQLSINLLSYYSFLYDKGTPNEFYGASSISYRPLSFPVWIRPFFLTAEVVADWNFASVENTFFSFGIDFLSKNPTDYYVDFRPFYFMSGSDFSSLSNGVGAFFESMLNFNIFSKNTPRFSGGISENASFRYAIFNFAGAEGGITEFLHTDFYRGKSTIPENTFIFSNASELYFVCLDPKITFFEVFIIKQYKIGAFYDFVLSDIFYSCVGGFLRTNISIAGLSDFIVDIGGGYDFSAETGIFVIGVKKHM